ncbi:MAG: transrane sensor histidine kinase transcription regulator protein [Proteobacteria bacterium]|nr:transrane sensor histidine kinase transcription regulator protein [Pseudomonadota bacterium]
MNRLPQWLADAGALLIKVGKWVAGFSFWQFVVFSLLVLVAGGIVDSALFPDRPEQGVVYKRARHAPPDAAVAPASVPASGASAEVIPPADVKQAADTARGAEGAAEVQIGRDGIVVHDGDSQAQEVRIGWKGISVTESGGAAPGENVADAQALDDSTIVRSNSTRGLVPMLLAALAIMWVLRYAVRSRVKADARVGQAEAAAEREALERKVVEARLQALQAQVEPHFLFNTLAAVEHLIETDPARAGEMQRHLIAFLRGAMPQMRGQTSCLGDEIELCRSYLAIMKIRMEDRLSYGIDMPADLRAAPFPVLMLQSVVENAIKHGLEPKAEGGSLLISARAAAGRLRVIVADSGLGFGNGNTAGTGIGLNNIRERLQALFGDRAALVISANAPTGAQVTIEVPLEGTDGNHRG